MRPIALGLMVLLAGVSCSTAASQTLVPVPVATTSPGFPSTVSPTATADAAPISSNQPNPEPTATLLSTPIPALSTPTTSATPAWTPYQSLSDLDVTVVDGTSWTRVDAGSLFNLDLVVSLWPSDGRILAVARHGNCPSYCVSEDDYLLSSPDGITWSLIGQLPPNPSEITSVFESRDFGFFAVGTLDGYGAGDHAGIWRSSDGSNWTSLSDQAVFARGHCGSTTRGEIYRVLATPSGLVAEGTGTWFSADGQHWQCVDQPNIGAQELANGSYAGISYNDGTATVWTSDDGLHWSKSSTISGYLEFASVAGAMVGVTDGDPKFPGDQKLFVSPDYATWQDRGNPFGNTDVAGLVSDGVRAAIVEEGEPGAIWVSSRDGLTWIRHALPRHPGDTAQDVALFGDSVIVSGWAGNDPVTAAVWVADVP